MQVQQCYGAFTERPVHAGQPVIRREVLKQMRWKDWAELAFGIAEDYEFNMECAYVWRKLMIVDIPLIRYPPLQAVRRWRRCWDSSRTARPPQSPPPCPSPERDGQHSSSVWRIRARRPASWWLATLPKSSAGTLPSEPSGHHEHAGESPSSVCLGLKRRRQEYVQREPPILNNSSLSQGA